MAAYYTLVSDYDDGVEIDLGFCLDAEEAYREAIYKLRWTLKSYNQSPEERKKNSTKRRDLEDE